MTKAERIAKRRESLMPGGIPRWIRVYDNEGESADRYTVIYTHAHSFGLKGWVPYLGMSAAPYHPQGIGLHGEMRQGDMVEGRKRGDFPPAIGRKGNLGRRIRFQDLPDDCKRAVVDDYAGYWNI